MTNYSRPKSGFTLIELLVVITIIGVLAAVGMVSYSAAGKGARDARRKTDLETVRQALVMYRSDKGCYPNSSTFSDMLTVLDGEDYISAPYPVDPKNIDPYIYTYTGSGSVPGCGVSGFTITVQLEKTGLPYPLSNP